LIALVIGLVTIILWAMGQMPKEWALGICAVCALKL
jgi:hypothetical protein